MMVDTTNASREGSAGATVKAASQRQVAAKHAGQTNARGNAYYTGAMNPKLAQRLATFGTTGGNAGGGIAGFPCPNPSHDCLTTGGPGCSDEVCCEAVCAVDPFCCTNSWDGLCVGEANSICFGVGPCPNPNHDCFTTGGPGCSDEACCNQICAIDPFCCDTAWDGICVGEAASQCGVPPCDVICPPGANQEIAPQCPVDGNDGTLDPNGGCNSIPAVFDSIACGQTVCGEISTYVDGPTGGAFRDTDWYAFSLGADTEVTWSVNASVPTAVFLLSGGCPTAVLFVGAGLCPNSVTACLQAGDYVAFVATAAFTGVPCGGGNNAYVATLSCQPCKFTGPCANLVPDHDCLTTGTPGCTDIDCCNTVCTVDPFCCQTAWDGICVSEAAQLCGFPPPANDNCEDRIEIFEGATPFVTVGATTDGPPHASCDFFGDQQVNQDIWYNYNAPASGTLTVSLCGSSYDTKVAVYEGCDCPVSDLNKLACNDDSCGLQSELTVQVVAGNCYKIRVGGFGAASGSGTLTLTLSCACPTCTADIAPPGGNGTVDIDDLFEVIGQWGDCD
jgi:hypothetical protein